MARPAKASASQLETLHNIVTKDLTTRLRGEHSTADIRAAIEWLKANNITGVAAENTPLQELSELIGEIDFEEVERGIR